MCRRVYGRGSPTYFRLCGIRPIGDAAGTLAHSYRVELPDELFAAATAVGARFRLSGSEMVLVGSPKDVNASASDRHNFLARTAI